MTERSGTSLQRAGDAGCRERRSRVLIVAGNGSANGPGRQLSDAMDGRAVWVRNAFRAVGELARSPAREPIELILLAESALRGVSDHPATALRRVDPSVRIFLVREAPAHAGEPAAPLEDVFDAVLHDWPSAEDVTGMQQGTQKAKVTGRKPDAGRPDSDAGAKGGSPEPRARAAELGDVDLVEAVLRSSATEEGALRETALQLIRQHTGWSDVALVEEKSTGQHAPPQPSPGSTGPGTACGAVNESTRQQIEQSHSPEVHGSSDEERAGEHAVPVRYGDRHLGTLRSRKAPQGELERWAHWLARWLALDEDHCRWRELAERDELTGAFNRRYFMTFLTEAIRHGAKKRLPVSVMVFDLDDFKRYNDEFGHAAGDEILRETVRLLKSVIRKSDRVCRIGGDEFAVIFTDPGGPRERGSAPPETAEVLAQRFQDQVCTMHFPKLGIEAPGTLSVSAGLATFPWDGWEPEALLHHADALALQSKRKGKNALTLGRCAGRE